MSKRARSTKPALNPDDASHEVRDDVKKPKVDLELDPKDNPTNLPDLSNMLDDETEENRIDLGKSTIPAGYDSGSYMGPSNAEDPYFNRFLQSTAKDGVIPFLTRGTKIVKDDVAFTFYSRDCDCDETVRDVWETKWAKLNKTVAPFKDQLLALYFRFIDWTYPAVDKKRFYRAYFQHDPPLHRGLVCAMLGLGVTYWKYSTQLCVKPIPPNLTQDLWKMSLHYIEHDIHCKGASLDTIQALLLYIQKRLIGEGIHEQVESRMQIGMLVSMAYSLGLHLDCSDWDIGEIEKFSRKRLWALVFYVDKWSAANLGHPSLLVNPGNQDAHVFESHWRQERRFVQLIRLTNILSKVLSQLYSRPETTLPKCTKGDLSIEEKIKLRDERSKTAKIAESLLSELRDWKVSLPEDLSEMKARNSLNYCSNGMIHLCALAIEVLVFRPLVLPCYAGKYRHEARDLVQRIIMFCLEITHPHLHAFWISSCRLSLSSLTHFVLRYHAQSPPAERKKNTPLMRSWLECLRSLSHAWEEGIGLSYYRMDALFYKGKTSLELPLIEEVSHDEDVDNAESGAKASSQTTQTTYPEDLKEEPLGLEEDYFSGISDGPSEMLFNDETLRDILNDLLWE